MLEQLFGSKTRWALIRLFVNNPETCYFVRELTRVLDTQINSIRRELAILSQIGLLVECLGDEFEAEQSAKKISTVGKKHYKLNTDFFLFNEIKSLVLKEEFVYEKKFVDRLSSIGEIYYLIFTGKFVGLSQMSVDLLVVGDLDQTKFAALIKKFEHELKKEINFTILSARDFIYRRSINDRFVQNVLASSGVVVIDKTNELASN